MSRAQPLGESHPYRSRSSGLLGWSLIGLVVAGGVALRLFGAGPLPIDAWWARSVVTARGSMLHAVAVFFAEVGTWVGAAAIGAVAIALLLVLGRRRDAGSVATALLFGVVASELLKGLVLRPRPGGQLYTSSGSSYPSGHSMGAAAIAVSLALVIAGSDEFSAKATRVAWLLAGAWIGVMMWSRTALRVHWLSDTVAGALLGIGVAVLARSLWFRPTPADATTPAPGS